MIEVTRLNGTTFAINPFQVEHMEETPDTVIYFTSGHKLIVREKLSEIEDRFAAFFGKAIQKGLKWSKEG